MNMSPLQKLRLEYKPEVAKALQDISTIGFEEVPSAPLLQEVSAVFPRLAAQENLKITHGVSVACSAKRVGVVFSGGQAAGGHNVIAALFDALHEVAPTSELFGFLNGPSGIVTGNYIPLTKEIIDSFRNLGGFDMIGSGRTKIETPEQLQGAFRVVKELKLDGLVIIGGDDSNTNAAYLAQYFLDQGLDQGSDQGYPISVIGIPKTIDGDLQNEWVSIPFGFDTACKVYSETIGNLAKDALSAKKYYYFIKLMGRSASHITLECAMETHPNLALIGEEVAAKKQTLSAVVESIVQLIQERAEAHKDYGVILIPEGLIEFMQDMQELIVELNRLLGGTKKNILEELSPGARYSFQSLPQAIQEQLLGDRDPHGNVQVSKIETERLLITLVREELRKRASTGRYKGTFSPQPIFCGYEGRSALPTNFDATYCYNLGRVAAVLIMHGKTGYMAALQALREPPAVWQPAAVSLVSMMHLEERKGKIKPVIKKTLVDLEGPVFKMFAAQREAWRLVDDYMQPGPIQFSS